jgi:hypothetical protein
MVWFTNRLFDIDLRNVSEVFIDATFGTNSQGAHLFCIMGEENGWGVPLAYMLVEAKEGEKTNATNHDLTACIIDFFTASQRLGLSPIFVHVDKCFAEINAAKVLLP